MSATITLESENVFMVFYRFTDAMEEMFCPVFAGYFLSFMGVLFFTEYCVITVSNITSNKIY